MFLLLPGLKYHLSFSHGISQPYFPFAAFIGNEDNGPAVIEEYRKLVNHRP